MRVNLLSWSTLLYPSLRSGIRVQAISNQSYQTARTMSTIPDIENIELLDKIITLHKEACEAGKETYIDPVSGYTCFTALQQGKRPCCGLGCRHCPYNHEKVKKSDRISDLTKAIRAREAQLNESSEDSAAVVPEAVTESTSAQ